MSDFEALQGVYPVYGRIYLGDRHFTSKNLKYYSSKTLNESNNNTVDIKMIKKLNIKWW